MSYDEIIILLGYILVEIEAASRLTENEVALRILADTAFQAKRLLKSLKDTQKD